MLIQERREEGRKRETDNQKDVAKRQIARNCKKH